MFWLFVVCAVLGGTVMLCQMVLTLIGLAGDSFDVDAGGDFDHGMDHGFDAGSAGDAHDVAMAHDGVHADHTDHSHGSTWLFKVVSFRTLIAAMTFFGLTGLAADSAQFGPVSTFALATAAGAAAMYGVYWMMQWLVRLRSEGTVRVQRAIGREGTVYLRIPGERSGEGKVTLDLQNRTVECSAITAGPELPTGAKIVVVGLVSQDTLEVEAATAANPAPLGSERESYV